MGRIKNDFWIKPTEPGSKIYKIRFTNVETMKYFTEVGVKKGIYKPNTVIFHLNEWHSCPNALVNHAKYGIMPEHWNSKIEYADISHFEHGV